MATTLSIPLGTLRFKLLEAFKMAECDQADLVESEEMVA